MAFLLCYGKIQKIGSLDVIFKEIFDNQKYYFLFY